MASSCSTFATLTNTITTFTESTFSTMTETVSTPPGSVSTQAFTTCVPFTIRNITTCSPTATSTEVTIPGTPTTITVPAIGTTHIPITTFATLFGSSCTTFSTPSNPPTSDSLPPSTTPPPTPTPTPTTLTSQTVFTSNSSTFTSIITTTSSVLPSGTSSDLPVPTGNSNKTSAPIGAIVGGVVGGVVALAVLGFLTWYLIRKQTGFDKFFNRDEDGTAGDSTPLKPQPTDKMYNYQLVGEGGSNPPNTGLTQDMGNAPPSQPSQPSAPGHARTPSMTPLIASVAGAAAISGGIAVAASSRRSNDSQPQPTQAAGAGPGGPPSGFPPTMQNWQAGQNQGVYGPLHQNQGYNPNTGMGGNGNMNVNAMGYPPGPPSNVTSMYTGSSATPGTPGTMNTGTGLLGHNTSVSSGSVYSGTHSPPASQWGGQSPVSTPFGPPATIVPMGAGMGMGGQSHPQQQQFERMHQQQQHQQHQQFGQAQGQQGFGNAYAHQQQQQQQPAFDPYAQSHTGSSSASPEPPRTLQVINADPYISTGSFAAYEAPGAGGLSSAGAGGSSGASAGVAGTSASASSGVDGKGRPIDTRGEKAALVHLDGGMYQEPAPGQLPSGAAPPAYGE